MTRKEAIGYFESQLVFLGRSNRPVNPVIQVNPLIVEIWELSLAALRDQEERENPERLTIEELKERDCPVWCSCNTWDGKNGFWCICNNGYITAPSGRCFAVEEIPQWKFYRYKRKEI